ncbi:MULTISPECIES: response regulator transcription factor [unclassified Pseudomonas]|uniref:response regulator transcription factor n=1 Tax=unclassified Pseudomonas TaxID=196821 RepID=UPI000BD8B08C|nr:MULTISPECIES: helix-turn-helix transcriptional regulator [unclassified Pseudomonas]PVZ12267.1 regulatory LuxR family protein [Pseudomonas sp. URIL14HWK12:I12]PVZ23581.1 regulatory LuxR family protein [Pseudomonas sp. URIL14HWK12:I10]PVZ32911.1 regulatory LuxR family protein [Pseudomonas sp. URIL14HWK12:I11]SNZ18779.1 Response regulator containing a CheY-like receiver domain and an HTH DNA-binding domain [Pseudomonas sp. URIL14HWK12:I9]
MNLTLQDLAWHRSVGQLIETLDQPHFWLRLVRLLEQYVEFDSWVALLFSNGRPQVFAASPGEDGGPDPLFEDYLKGLYLLDPFYIASREAPATGLQQLAFVAPECFEQTDYYRRYFRLNVVADEIQYNVQLDAERTLCLSLGCRTRYSVTQIALLELVQPWVTAVMRQRLNFESITDQAVPEPKWQNRLEEAVEKLETPLTARELEVGRMLLSGYSSKEIARKLAISSETVRVHRKHIYSKLNIKSQSELFALFLRAQD